MTKLFKKLPEAERKSARLEVRLTQKEAKSISDSARIRNLSVAEFIRRTALGRRADVKYETEIVLALRDVVQAIRIFHSTLLEMGIAPTTEEWRPLIHQASAAMARISK